MRRSSQRLTLLLVLCFTDTSALAASCGGDFAAFIAAFSREAATQKVSPRALAALATLAHDCRRSGMFQGELLAALRIIDRGDMSAAEMRGAWAGELGQTQFLPSSYLKYAVDFDGNGRRDLIRSVPDVLASTANYLKGYGWQRGQPWTEGTHNFAVLKEWNKAAVYQKTIALFATRLSEAR